MPGARKILALDVLRSALEPQSEQLESEGRGPRIYDRVLVVEKITVVVRVLVADEAAQSPSSQPAEVDEHEVTGVPARCEASIPSSEPGKRSQCRLLEGHDGHHDVGRGVFFVDPRIDRKER